MRKLIIHVSLVVCFIIIYFLQSLFFTHFTIAGIMPNIFILLMLYIGLYMGRSMGITYGIIFGILIDIWIGRVMGITSIALAIIGLIAGSFDKTFSKDSRIIVVAMSLICTIIYEIVLNLIQYIVLKTNFMLIPFIKILIIETSYNVILAIILYPLMKITGYEIENEIKGNKILTRYF